MCAEVLWWCVTSSRRWQIALHAVATRWDRVMRPRGGVPRCRLCVGERPPSSLVPEGIGILQSLSTLTSLVAACRWGGTVWLPAEYTCPFVGQGIDGTSMPLWWLLRRVFSFAILGPGRNRVPLAGWMVAAIVRFRRVFHLVAQSLRSLVACRQLCVTSGGQGTCEERSRCLCSCGFCVAFPRHPASMVTGAVVRDCVGGLSWLAVDCCCMRVSSNSLQW